MVVVLGWGLIGPVYCLFFSLLGFKRHCSGVQGARKHAIDA